MGKWRYSEKRLDELNAELADLEAEADALDVGGPRANGVKFANAASRDRYNEIFGQRVRTTDERDRCNLALWRRRRQFS